MNIRFFSSVLLRDVVIIIYLIPFFSIYLDDILAYVSLYLSLIKFSKKSFQVHPLQVKYLIQKLAISPSSLFPGSQHHHSLFPTDENCSHQFSSPSNPGSKRRHFCCMFLESGSSVYCYCLC